MLGLAQDVDGAVMDWASHFANCLCDDYDEGGGGDVIRNSTGYQPQDGVRRSQVFGRYFVDPVNRRASVGCPDRS